MRKIIYVLLISTSFLVSCTNKEVDELKARINELEQEINEKENENIDLNIENLKISHELENTIREWENFGYEYFSEPEIYRYKEYRCTKIETLKVLEKIDLNKYDETGPYILVEKYSSFPRIVEVPLEIYQEVDINKYYRFTFESTYNLNSFLLDATEPVRDLVKDNMNTILKYEKTNKTSDSTWFGCSR